MTSIPIPLPQLGESIVEGTVSVWLVKEGDRVEIDQPLVEVTTDKADTELPSPAAGVIEQVLVAEGETVPVGAELARLRLEPAAKPGASAPPPSARHAAALEPAHPERGATPRPDAAPGAPLRATPVARRAAQAEGVDLHGLVGTGTSGRVTRRDVERASQAASAPAPPAATPRVAAPPPAAAAPRARPAYLDYALQEGDRVRPMSPQRRIVAEHMVLSKRVSPHVGTVAEVDLHDVVRLRTARRDEFEQVHGFGLTFLPFIVHATVRALRERPALNASVVGDTIVEKASVHVGIATETDKGLVVPVVRHADRLSLSGLARAIRELSVRARTKKLTADDLRGGSFTVSNPGRHGNLYGFAIINQPQVGILRVGEIVKRPVVRELDGADAIVVRPIVHLALSYDHRAVDGAPANAFLHRIREILESADFQL